MKHIYGLALKIFVSQHFLNIDDRIYSRSILYFLYSEVFWKYEYSTSVFTSYNKHIRIYEYYGQAKQSWKVTVAPR